MHNHSKSKKGRVVILVLEMSSSHVLHFYHVPSNYSEGYSSYTKSFSNKIKEDNSKSMNNRVSILVRYPSSYPFLHFRQVSPKYSKGYSSYKVDKKFNTNAHTVLSCSTFLPSIIKIFQRVFKLYSRQKVLPRFRQDPSQKQYVPPTTSFGSGVGAHSSQVHVTTCECV